MNNTQYSEQMRARRRDRPNPIVAGIPVSTVDARRRGAAARQAREGVSKNKFHEAISRDYGDQSAGGWTEPRGEERRDGASRYLLFKWLIMPAVIFILGWRHQKELRNAARILENSVAWGLLSLAPVVLSWVSWKVVRHLWGHGYKRTAFLGGVFGCVMIIYLALNIAAPIFCDDVIDSATRQLPSANAQVFYARRGATWERVNVPIKRRINTDEIRRSAVFVAVLAIEDERFIGRITGPIDPKALLRATIHNLMRRRGRQGGSTILVQAAKMIQGKSKSSIGDKPFQFLLALRLNQRFPTYEEQLALYLSLVQIDGPHGVAYAVADFFGAADLSDLKLTEPEGIAASALLAGMLKDPAKFHPRNNPQNALSRRNLVLRKMWEAGVFDDLRTMQAAPLNLRASPQSRLSIL